MRVSASFQIIPRHVGRLGLRLRSGPHVVGRFGSRVRVSANFQIFAFVRSIEDIEFCMQMFSCPSVDLTVAKRKVKFFYEVLS